MKMESVEMINEKFFEYKHIKSIQEELHKAIENADNHCEAMVKIRGKRGGFYTVEIPLLYLSGIVFNMARDLDDLENWFKRISASVMKEDGKIIGL